MTSNDRHASHDSPFRTGQHAPLSQSQSHRTPLTATTSRGSTTDFDLEAGNGFVTSHPSGTASPPYSPGRRTSLQRQGSGLQNNVESAEVGEIQMQSFSDGLPPPPPASHSWRRIDRWLEDNYEELFENLCGGATINDINELEHTLDCTLPTEVRESLQTHDGQERGGLPTGVIFGCMLLDCEEMVHEWQNWQTVNEAYLDDPRGLPTPATPPIKAFAASSSAAAPDSQSQLSGSPQWRSDLLDKQDSQPPNAIQKVYTHPGWIPLARDWGGNNIAVDLAPGPAGRWGQIILIGRDYDCKYVVSRSWSAFLATLSDDMDSDKWFIDEDTNELKLREFKQPGVEPAYIDILRWRSDQKFGRRPPKKRPLPVNPNLPPSQNSHSPYDSPTGEDRGRSPQRFANGKAAATSSPRGHVGSPLARVTEEISPTQPLSLNTNVDPVKGADKLISGIDTPVSSQPSKSGRLSTGESQRLNGTGDEHRPMQFPKSPLSSGVLNSGDDEGSEFPSLAPSHPTDLSGPDEGMKDIPI